MPTPARARPDAGAGHRHARVPALAVLVGLVLTATACAPDDGDRSPVEQVPAVGATVEPDPAPTPPSAPTPAPTAQPDDAAAAQGTAAAALALLDVKGRGPRTGYERDHFGSGWVDVDRNGCDTRNDVLARDLTGETVKPGTRGCVVLTGTLADPYSGTTIAFRRGQDTSDDVQVDHVVALSDAWQKGAQRWGDERRVRFANDPLNLLAVDGPLNQQKGDGDAATWLPPAKGYRCAYVARQVAVKTRYDLWVTPAERDAMARVLASCPDQTVPDGGLPVRAEPDQDRSPEPSGTADHPRPDDDAVTVTAPFENCAAARAAGAAPVRRGDPGYGPHLDGDGDGVGCEG